MMPDHHNAENAKSEFELAELVGRIGNFYTKKGLSPPFFLRDAAREWHGLNQERRSGLAGRGSIIEHTTCRR